MSAAIPAAAPRPSRYAVRLSVVDACDFRCRYCRPDGVVREARRPAVRRLERVTAWLSERLDARRVRLTGGEPLLRSDIVEIVGRLARLPRVDELSLTTNGSRLAELAGPLKRAGLSRVNVSLDSVDPDRFAAITGGGRLGDTLDGIEAALAAGLTPLKLNAVLLEPGWRADLPALLSRAAGWGVELRLIELMPVRCGSPGAGLAEGGVGAGTVLDWLARRTDLAPLSAAPGAAARRGRVAWNGAQVEVGWITPVTAPFCGGCDRLRVDAGGRLRRCLMDPRTWPLAERLESDGAAEGGAVVEEVRRFLGGKAPPRGMTAPCTMDLTGG
jgi:cyclic pyranopterin phosphate synthase